MNITDAEAGLLKIIVLDYIVANTDRHSFNISFIRDSNTLQWKGVAPVYDTGKSMFLNLLDFEMDMLPSVQIEAKPFFENQVKQVQNLPVQKIASFIDLSKLDDIDEWYTEFLKPLKRLSAEKKAALVKKLRERIDETKAIFADFVKRDEGKHGDSAKMRNSELVYEALKLNPKRTKEEIASATGLSRATVTRMYKLLEAEGRIRRVGSNKTGYWEIL